MLEYVSEPSFRYGLERLFWVLPHPERPGRAVPSALDLQKPTVLVGSNGVGKTSILRLVAFLFGHPDPDSLVGGGRSFLELYLNPSAEEGPHRRHSGYVMGHFRGREGYTTVIAYAQGRQYRYLVLPGKIEPEILKEGERFLSPDELRQRLAARGLVGESVLEARSPQAYASLFAHRSRSPLRGHAFPSGRRSSLGWFLGLFLGETLKEEWIRKFLVGLALPPSEEETQATPEFERRLGEVRQELEEVAQMASTMPRVEEYGKAREDLEGNVRRYGALRLRAEEALPSLEEKARRLEAEAAQLGEALERLEGEREERLGELERAIRERAKREGHLTEAIRSREETLHKAQEALAPWRSLVGPYLPQRREEVRRELELLAREATERHAAWEAERQRRRAERERLRAEGLQELARRREKLLEELKEAEEAARARLEAWQREEEGRLEAERKALEEARLRLREKRARLQATLEPEDAEWRQVRERIDALKEELRLLQKALEGKRAELKTAREDLKRERQNLERMREEVDRLRAALGRLAREGSLLRFLERNVPGWEEGVGKLLAPELLERDDLEPQLISPPPLPQGRVGVGEVSLHTAPLPAPANPLAELKAKLEKAEAALRQREATLPQSEAWVKGLEEEVQALEGRERELGKSLEDLEGWRKERERAFRREREAELARLGKELKEVEAKLEALAQRLEGLRQEGKKRLAEALEGARRPFRERLAALEEEAKALDKPAAEEPPPELRSLEERRRVLEEELRNLEKALEAWEALKRAEREAEALPALKAELAQVQADLARLEERKNALRAEYREREEALRRRRDEVRREAEAARAMLGALKKALADTPQVAEVRERLALQVPRSARAAEPPFPELPPETPQGEALRGLWQEVERAEERVRHLRDRLKGVFRRLDLEDPLPEELKRHYQARGLALSRSLAAQVQFLEAKLTQIQAARRRLARLVGEMRARLASFAFPSVRWAEVHLKDGGEEQEKELEEALDRLRDGVAAVVDHFEHPDLQPLFPVGDLQGSLRHLERVGKRYAEVPVEELLSQSFRLAFVLERGGKRVPLESLAKLKGVVSTGQGVALGHALAASVVSLLDGGAQVRLPLLVDELGRLDGENAAALFRGLEALGLTLLGAVPSKEVLAEVAGRVDFQIREVRSMAVRPSEGVAVGTVARRRA
ncbi:hypothetical protein TJA_19350 [Thermus sp. LT1-2-5]|uniref:ATP-binding protein n=1 Tax=Thermus sp. LT1-2-5 TaxID=3026935 RepID=UPI0030EB0F82